MPLKDPAKILFNKESIIQTLNSLPKFDEIPNLEDQSQIIPEDFKSWMQKWKDFKLQEITATGDKRPQQIARAKQNLRQDVKANINTLNKVLREKFNFSEEDLSEANPRNDLKKLFHALNSQVGVYSSVNNATDLPLEGCINKVADFMKLFNALMLELYLNQNNSDLPHFAFQTYPAINVSDHECYDGALNRLNDAVLQLRVKPLELEIHNELLQKAVDESYNNSLAYFFNKAQDQQALEVLQGNHAHLGAVFDIFLGIKSENEVLKKDQFVVPLYNKIFMQDVWYHYFRYNQDLNQQFYEKIGKHDYFKIIADVKQEIFDKIDPIKKNNQNITDYPKISNDIKEKIAILRQSTIPQQRKLIDTIEISDFIELDEQTSLTSWKDDQEIKAFLESLQSKFEELLLSDILTPNFEYFENSYIVSDLTRKENLDVLVEIINKGDFETQKEGVRILRILAEEQFIGHNQAKFLETFDKISEKLDEISNKIESNDFLKDTISTIKDKYKESQASYHQLSAKITREKISNGQRTSLLDACDNNDYTLAKIILESDDTRISDEDENEKSPFYFTAKNGNIELIKLLKKYNNDLVSTKSDYCSNKPIHVAAKNLHQEMTLFLLDDELNSKFKDPNDNFYDPNIFGVNIFHLLAFAKEENLQKATQITQDIIDKILQKSTAEILKKALNLKDNNNNKTPLDCAITNDNLELAILMLDHGATPSFGNNKNIFHLLASAQKEDHHKVTKISKNLIDSILQEPGKHDLEQALNQIEYIKDEEDEIEEIENSKPIDWAIENDNLELAILMLRNGANASISFSARKNETSLHLNQLHDAINNDNLEKINSIITDDSLDYLFQINIDNETPLERAIYLKKTEIVEILLNSQKIDVYYQNHDNTVAIDTFLENLIDDQESQSLAEEDIKKSAQILRMLINHGATIDLNSKSNWHEFDQIIKNELDYYFALQVKKAIEDQNNPISNPELFSQEADSDLIDSSIEYIKTIKQILEINKNLSSLPCPDHENDKTILHLAVAENRADIIQALADGGDLFELKTNINGKTALDYAREQEKNEIAQIIEDVKTKSITAGSKRKRDDSEESDSEKNPRTSPSPHFFRPSSPSHDRCSTMGGGY